MIEISAIILKPKKKTYVFSHEDLSAVRDFLASLRGSDESTTQTKVDGALKAKLKLPNGEGYTVGTRISKIDPDNFTVISDKGELTAKQLNYLHTLVECAISSQTAVLVFPSYLHLASVTKKTKIRKRKSK